MTIAAETHTKPLADDQCLKAIIQHCHCLTVKVNPEDPNQVVGMVIDIRADSTAHTRVQRDVKAVLQRFAQGAQGPHIQA